MIEKLYTDAVSLLRQTRADRTRLDAEAADLERRCLALRHWSAESARGITPELEKREQVLLLALRDYEMRSASCARDAAERSADLDARIRKHGGDPTEPWRRFRGELPPDVVRAIVTDAAAC